MKRRGPGKARGAVEKRRSCPEWSPVVRWALAVVLVAAPALSQPISPLGNDFQVNSYTTSDQRLPALAVEEDGDFVVVWQSQDQDGDAYGLFGQRYDSAGSPSGGEFSINGSIAGDQSRASLALFESGEFVVVWDSTSSPADDVDNRSILARRFASDGSPLGAEFQVNVLTTGAQLRPAVASQPGGEFVVVWESVGSSGTDSSDYSIQGRRFDSAGSAQGGEFQVNEITTGRQVDASVATSADGAFVVTWANAAGTDGDGRSIAGRRLASDGGFMGAEFQVNVYTTGEQLAPAVASTDAGAFLVTWQGPRPNGEGDEIVGRRFDADGVALGVEFRVNSHTTGEQAAPSVRREDGGLFVVAWQSASSTGSDSDGASLQGRVVSAGGNPLDADFQLNTYTTQYQTGPSVGVSSDGTFVVAWSNFENIGLQVVDGSSTLGTADDRSVRARRLGLTAADLSLPEGQGAVAGETVEVPVVLGTQGLDLASVAFSIDYDENCLSFDASDVDMDGVPDALAFDLPGAFDISAFHDAGDTDGEIDLVVADVPPEVTLADGVLVGITFDVNCTPPLGGSIIAPMAFADDPAASFGDLSAESVAGRVHGGSLFVVPGPRGDCNGDGFVDAPDVSAVGLELFDADGTFWLDTPGSSFEGSPGGCDANGDTAVDAGDVACVVRRIFSASCDGEPGLARPRLELPADLLVSPDDTVSYPLSFAGNGQAISTVALSFDIDTTRLVFDPTDADLDGIPDSVRFLGTAASVRSVVYDPADLDGELDLLITDLSATPVTLADGTLLEIDFGVPGGEPILSQGLTFGADPGATFGDDQGRRVDGDSEVVVLILFTDGFESGDVSAWATSVP